MAIIREVKIENIGAALTDYQVNIRHDALRGLGVAFWTDVQKTTAVNFWKESEGSFWVKVNLPENGSTSIYIEYGDDVAITTGDGNLIFDFFDDFSGTSIDTTKWTVQDTGNNLSVSNGKLVIAGGTDTWGDTTIYANTTFDRSSEYIFEARWLPKANRHIMLGWKDNTAGTSYENLVYAFYDTKIGTNKLRVYEDSNLHYEDKYILPDNVWHGVQVQLKSAGAEYRYSKDNRQFQTFYSSTYSSETPLRPAIVVRMGPAEADHVLVRKHSTNTVTVHLAAVQPAKYRIVTITNNGAALTNHQIKVENLLQDESNLMNAYHMNDYSTELKSTGPYRDPAVLSPGCTFVNGREGRALQLNSSSDFARIDHSASVNMFANRTALSIELWGKFSADGVIIGDRFHEVSWETCQLTTSTFTLNSANDNTTQRVTLNYTSVADNTWHYIVATWDGSNMRVYIDGSLVAGPAAFTGSTWANNHPITIGSEFITSLNNPASNAAVGQIEYLKVYSRALSNTEVSDRFNNTNFRADYSDVRFFSNREFTTEIPFWKETDGTFWVKVPTINASPNTTEIYAAYGNADEIEGSNGNRVFEFFDDFSDGMYKWIDGYIITTPISFDLTPSRMLKGGNTRRTLTSRASIPGPVILETVIREVAPAADGFTTLGSWISTSDGLSILSYNHTSYYRTEASWTHFSFDSSTEVAVRDQVMHNMTNGRVTRARVDGSQSYDSGFVINNVWLDPEGEPIRIGARGDNDSYNYTFTCYWDFILARKYTANTFTLSVGNEQEIPVLAHSFLGEVLGDTMIGHYFAIPVSAEVRGQYLVFPKNTLHDTLGMRSVPFKKGDFD